MIHILGNKIPRDQRLTYDIQFYGTPIIKEPRRIPSTYFDDTSCYLKSKEKTKKWIDLIMRVFKIIINKK